MRLGNEAEVDTSFEFRDAATSYMKFERYTLYVTTTSDPSCCIFIYIYICVWI
ncbi:hypothetical protein K474DRAFT_1667713, partial [Panus rudis PR-1116 ss-1]